jgi:colicin import membrane protein
MAATIASSQFNRRRVEPGKLPAGLLALGVHIAFFALIVFGVSWNVKSPEPIAVEVWSALPPIQNAQAVAVLPPPAPTPPPPEAVIEKVAEPPPIAKPAPIPPPAVKAQTPPLVDDINLKLAKKKAEEAQKQALAEQLQKEKLKEDAKKKELLDAQKAAEKIKLAEEAKKAETAQQLARAAAAEQLAAQITAQNIQAARNAAIANYGSKIAELIRNRANVPDTVVGNPIVQVRLRLLTNGAVLDATVVKPSGNRPYDESVERAINSIRNWPLPDNPEILGQRKELNLNIRHEK